MTYRCVRAGQGEQVKFVSNAIRTVFPDQCLQCDALVDGSQALCGSCWRDTGFITGTVCDACGTPLMGRGDGSDHCDDCLKTPRAWSRGRAALRYEGAGRRLVLGLKHGDRVDVARPAAGWMQAAARPILTDTMVVVPVPIHRTRLLRRRYNQSALLARHLATQTGLDLWPDALLRARRTPVQDGMTHVERFENLDGAIITAPTWAAQMKGAEILIVDDVMTSGATLEAAARACLAAGATQVSVVVLARVAKSP